MTHKPTFTRLDETTNADWEVLGAEHMQMAEHLPDRVMEHLKLLDGDFGGFPIDRFQHSLQTATRALRDGKDEEYIICALLHDIGDTLGSYNHADIAAAILQPFVSEENYWMIKHHAIFQGHFFFEYLGLDKNMRDQFKDHPCYERTVEFCAYYDNPAFDPKYDTLPLSEFEPMLRRVFSAPKSSIYKTDASPT